jgi:hypothetical protein
VALLDEKMPGWVDRIDVDTLRIDSLCHCVVGQLNQGNFTLGIMRLGLGAYANGAEYGFAWAGGYGTSHDEEYLALTTEWKRVIGILRDNQVPVTVEPKELTLV